MSESVERHTTAMSHHCVERVRRLYITGRLEAQQLPRSLDVQVGPQQRLQLASEGYLLQGPRDRAPQQKHVRKRNQPLMRQMSEESHAESHAFQPWKSAQIHPNISKSYDWWCVVDPRGLLEHQLVVPELQHH